VAAEVLPRRARNRALLARQLLLGRVRRPVAETVEHLVGLQAQAPLPPYLALWSRLEAFDPAELGRLLTERAAVRMTLMRGTVHLVSVRDAVLLRPLVQGVIERGFAGTFGRRVGRLDPDDLDHAVRELLADGPQTAVELGRRLVARGLGDDAEALGIAARVHVPLVQVPPRGVWGAGGQARYATLFSWTGAELDEDASLDELVLRYLRAFGPASARDVQTWSGRTRLGPVLERLRPQLAVFADEEGRELFDLPGAPRPDPATPAPVRLLGEFDNVLLSHADRRHVVPEGFPSEAMLGHGRRVQHVLVDGMLRATWWLEQDGTASATLGVRPHGELTAAEHAEVTAEAERALELLASGVGDRRVVFADPV
jgi:hypothetical protein